MATIDCVKYLVLDMEKQWIKGRIISTDCLYTNTESANWLLTRDITTVGTLQKGRQGTPSELFNTKDRDEFSTTNHFERDIYFTSCTIKVKSKGKKDVALF